MEIVESYTCCMEELSGRRTASEILASEEKFYSKLGKTIDDCVNQLKSAGCDELMSEKLCSAVIESAIYGQTEGLWSGGSLRDGV